jgi:hypothetical protein
VKAGRKNARLLFVKAERSNCNLRSPEKLCILRVTNRSIIFELLRVVAFETSATFFIAENIKKFLICLQSDRIEPV